MGGWWVLRTAICTWTLPPTSPPSAPSPPSIMLPLIEDVVGACLSAMALDIQCQSRPASGRRVRASQYGFLTWVVLMFKGTPGRCRLVAAQHKRH